MPDSTHGQGMTQMRGRTGNQSANMSGEQESERGSTEDQPRSHSHSRHSRSPRRRRHAHGHGSGHRRRHWHIMKDKERNFLAAVCSMVVIVIMSTAMAEPDWIYVGGGGCRDQADAPVHQLGLFQFFVQGKVEKGRPEMHHKFHYNYFWDGGKQALVDCVDSQAISIMQAITAMCFLGVFGSLVAFCLDLVGPTNKVLKFLRRKAVFNILTVLLCVTINGLCYWVTQIVHTIQKETRQHMGSRIQIRFEMSFYLIAAGGGMSVAATACNLLRRPHFSSSTQSDVCDHQRLIESFDAAALDSSLQNEMIPGIPPPPPYTP